MTKNQNEESDEGYFLKVDIQYPGKLHELHNDLPVLTGKMKTEKMKKLVTNLLEKTDYVMHIKNLKQALNHEFILKKDYLVIKFNKNNWLKLYIY